MEFPGNKIQEFKAEVFEFTRQSEWDAKEERIEQERRSLELWGKLSREDQEILFEMVSEGLDFMKNNVTKWVPTSFTDAPGQGIDISFRIMFSAIKDDRVGEVEYRRKMREGAEEMQEMIRKTKDL